ncbi:unnamed protein product, partial [Arctogadus glacialis]
TPTWLCALGVKTEISFRDSLWQGAGEVGSGYAAKKPPSPPCQPPPVTGNPCPTAVLPCQRSGHGWTLWLFTNVNLSPTKSGSSDLSRSCKYQFKLPGPASLHGRPILPAALGQTKKPLSARANNARGVPGAPGAGVSPDEEVSGGYLPSHQSRCSGYVCSDML